MSQTTSITARFLRLLPLLVLAFIVARSSHGFPQQSDSTRFRGSDGRGQSSATDLPTTWSDDENLIWKVELPGAGASSPVSFQGKIYVTCYSGYGLSEDEPGEMADLTRHLVCIDPSQGKILWDSPLPSAQEQGAYRGFVALHGYASSTPTIDASGIYVYYGTTGAAAYDLAGNLRWNQQLGEGTHGFGTANSPVIAGDLVICNASVECGDLVALDKQTGKEAWRVAGIERSWNTPIVYDSVTGRRELAVNTQGKILAFDPSTGNKLWECTGIDDYICPSIIEQDGILYALGGRQRTLVAVKSGGSGDVTESHVLWRMNRGSNVSSAVYHNGYLYWAHEQSGIVYCADATTGEEVYEQRLDPNPGRIYASPLAADGKIYYQSREKGTLVVAAKPEFELLAHNTLASDTSVFNGSPIVVAGRLILRSDKALYCIGRM